MNTRHVRDKVRDRYVYYPVQKQWFRACGGPLVTREHVARACNLCEVSLIGYEAIQSDGIDHARAGAYRR